MRKALNRFYEWLLWAAIERADEIQRKVELG